MERDVEIVEVGPRDGLQTESVQLSTATKVELIRKLEAAGARRVEVASFVNPKVVPQMADAEALLAALPRSDTTRIGLVLNERGAQRALAAGIGQLGLVCAASDAFGLKNQGKTGEQSLEMALRLLALARHEGRPAQVTISVAFGCPYSGDVPHDRVVEYARRLADGGPAEIALADTIGVAAPGEVERLVRRVIEAIRPLPIRVHFHDTRATGIANVWAAYGAGARSFDASIGGLGGCPFAPGAAGNVATGDVGYMFERSRIRTGLDLAQLGEVAGWLRKRVRTQE
ncbi:MAG: hydroxymethylglutaryl-CoA lyase, partial [Polyangiales bacterium]